MTDFSKAQVSIAALAAPSELQLLEVMTEIQQKMLEAEQELLESQQKMDVAMGKAMKDASSDEADSMRQSGWQQVTNSAVQATTDGGSLLHDPISRKSGSYQQATNELHAAESWQTALKDLDRQPGGQVRVGQAEQAAVAAAPHELEQARVALKEHDLSRPFDESVHGRNLQLSSSSPELSEAHDAFRKEVDRRVKRTQRAKDNIDQGIDSRSQRIRNLGMYTGPAAGAGNAMSAAGYKADAGEDQFLQQVAQYASTATQSVTRSADSNVSGAEDNKRQTLQTMAKIAEANRA